MNVFFLFSLFEEDDPLAAFMKLTPQARERLLLLGAIGLVILILVLWVLLFRHSRRRAARREDRHRRKHSLAKRTAKGVAELKEYLEERQRQRRRRRHRPRNPTLAETGGLPPVRDERSSSPGNSLPPD